MWSLSLLVSVSLFYHQARDALLLLPGSWRALSIERGEVSIVRKDGSSLQGRVEGRSFVSPHFVVLRVRPPDAHWTSARVIFPDALEGDAYRELCVRLKFP